MFLVVCHHYDKEVSQTEKYFCFDKFVTKITFQLGEFCNFLDNLDSYVEGFFRITGSSNDYREKFNFE